MTGKLDYVDDFEGDYNFYIQLLVGDRTDNIKGIDGIGPVKAAKILANCKTKEELHAAVLKVYIENYGHTPARVLLLERGRLLWLRRSVNQLWSLPT
jgi:hypothetical protein